MVYTDKIHLVSDSINELHEFANLIELKKYYYHGFKKEHPHYDLTNNEILNKAINNGAIIKNSKEILLISKKSKLNK